VAPLENFIPLDCHANGFSTIYRDFLLLQIFEDAGTQRTQYTYIQHPIHNLLVIISLDEDVTAAIIVIISNAE
jgi:hypothetical protein